MTEELRVIISAEVGELQSECKKASKSIEEISKEAEQAKKSLQDGLGKASDAVVSSVKKVGVAVAAGVTALVGLSAATEEYRTNQAKLTTAFEAAGSNAETATQTYNDLYRVLGESDTAVEAANHLAKLTTNEQDLSEWTTICEGVYATFGASLPIEGLTEAANETAKVGTVTGTLADALNWAGISEDAFNEKLAACNTEAEREALIRQTLNGAYAEAAAGYEQNAAALLAQNEAQNQLNNAMATLGAAMTPVVTMLMEFGANVLSTLTPYIQSFAENYLPTIQRVLEGVASAIGVVFGWISENWGIISTIATIIGSIAAAIVVVNTALTAYNAVMGVVAVVTNAATWPILAVVAAIAAVIAIIVLCIQHWDQIKETVSNVVEAIKNFVSNMVDAVTTFFSNMWEGITSTVENIKTSVVNAFNAVKTTVTNIVNGVKTTVLNIFNAIKTGISNVVNGIKTTVSNIFNGIKTTMSNTITAAKNTVLGIFDGIKNGISNAINGAKNIVGNAIDAIKGFFKFEWSLPKLKLPHISITGSFSLVPPSVPKFGIEWYAEGGVFDSPTLFNYGGGIGGLGEAGAEAVVPLEKNTKWLDRIAERLAGYGGDKPIILQVDGKTFAQTSIDSINQLTRQTGKLGLRLT